jgi:hypothetical protein
MDAGNQKINVDMKIPYVLLLALSLFSCQSEQDKLVHQYTKTLEEAIKDEAFKANRPVQLLEVRFLSDSTITQNELDLRRLAAEGDYRQNLRDRAGLEIQFANLLIADASAHSKLANLKGKAQSDAEMAVAKAQIKQQTDNAKTYLDSAQLLMNDDSITRTAIRTRENGGEQFHLVKYIQKSTIAQHNALDTLQSVFDKNMHLVPPRIFGQF